MCKPKSEATPILDRVEQSFLNCLLKINIFIVNIIIILFYLGIHELNQLIHLNTIYHY
jgi:hypothetical protein